MTEQELAERKQREHLADLDLMRRLALEMTPQEMERIFIDYVKSKSIEEIENLVNFDSYYRDYEHFEEAYNSENLYEVALSEKLKGTNKVIFGLP